MIKRKKGNILTENVIFIVLNIIFISILIIFIFTKTNGAAILEEKYAKQIALALDEAEPGMTIHINMKDAIDIVSSNNISPKSAVIIAGNVVTVKLRNTGGYSYSFFNNVNVQANFDSQNKQEYYFVVS